MIRKTHDQGRRKDRREHGIGRLARIRAERKSEAMNWPMGTELQCIISARGYIRYPLRN